jgi:hypothetical protein
MREQDDVAEVRRCLRPTTTRRTRAPCHIGTRDVSTTALEPGCPDQVYVRSESSTWNTLVRAGEGSFPSRRPLNPVPRGTPGGELRLDRAQPGPNVGLGAQADELEMSPRRVALTPLNTSAAHADSSTTPIGRHCGWGRARAGSSVALGYRSTTLRGSRDGEGCDGRPVT